MKTRALRGLIILLLSVSPMAGRPALSQNQPSALQTPTKVTAPLVDTSHWKTYRNEKHGFEVKYPETWGVHVGSGIGPDIISLNSPLAVGQPNASLTLAIQRDQNPRKLSIEEWFTAQLQATKATPDSSGRVIIGGQPAMFMENTNSFGKNRDTFTLLHETSVLSLSYFRQAQFDQTCAAIVSSFRVVN